MVPWDTSKEMLGKEARKNPRVSIQYVVRITWNSSQGAPSFMQGKCRNVSHKGLCIELPTPIPARSLVSMQVDKLGLNGSATIRYGARVGSRYLHGVELSRAIPLETKL